MTTKTTSRDYRCEWFASPFDDVIPTSASETVVANKPGIIKYKLIYPIPCEWIEVPQTHETSTEQ